MLTMQDMMYFIHPVNDPTLDAERVLVMEAKRSDLATVGRVVEVTGRYMDGGRLWRESHDGYWVDGAVENPRITGGTEVVGICGDVFIYGTAEWGAQAGYRRIRNPRRSDQRKVMTPGVPDLNYSEVITSWFRAAEWADETMPHPDDDELLVAEKLALAKAYWKEAKAHAALLRESAYRGWQDHLETVMASDGVEMPGGRFAAYVTGSVYLPARDVPDLTELPARMSESLNALRSRSLDGAVVSGSAMEVRVVYLARVNVETPADLHSVSAADLQAEARRYLENNDLRIGSHQATAILRGLAS
jgi:hypothetical protein